MLVPLRDGTPTGALRFDLAAGDPARAAHAWIGALGRFGRVEHLVIVLFSSRGRTPSASALVSALSTRAERLGVAVDVLVATGPPAARPAHHGSGLLPVVDRAEALAVAAQVDALLDRHPRARLPEALAADADSLLLCAASGRPWRQRTRALAVLIVCAQRQQGRERVMSIVASADRDVAGSVLELVAHAAAAAPATERAPLLVLLAMLHWSSGPDPSAAVFAGEALRLDPHDPGSRLLVAALGRGEQCPWAAEGRRAA